MGRNETKVSEFRNEGENEVPGITELSTVTFPPTDSSPPWSQPCSQLSSSAPDICHMLWLGLREDMNILQIL